MIKRFLLCGLTLLLFMGNGEVNVYAAESNVIYQEAEDAQRGVYAEVTPKMQDVDILRAADETGNFEYVILEDGTIEISKYVGTDTEVVIPEEIDGKTVTSVGGWTFSSSNVDIVGIKLPETLKILVIMHFI